MKTTPATSFWLLLAAVALCALFAWGSATVLLRQAFTQAAAEAGRAVGAMQDGDDRETRETFLLAANRARFLALVPPIAGIGRALLNNAIDPVDGTSLALWRTRLEQISTAWIASTPDVYEARLIGAADGGRELVRVHQDAAGTVSVVAPPVSPVSE